MSKLHMLKSVRDTICESFVIESEGKVIVIDGGFEEESAILYEKLLSLGAHVDAWFFTHPHNDHFGAFCRLLEQHSAEISVDAVYCNFADDELLIKYEPIEEEHTKTYLPWIRSLIEKNGIRRITMRKGDEYLFGDARFTVLREPDTAITENFINNSTTVFRLDTNGKSVLFLGDLGVEGGQQLLETCSPSLIKADYVQMAHHGQNGVDFDVYKAVEAKVCLWCTPTWLWDNMGPNGYDSGNYKTVIVRGWMSSLGARMHYVNMNGPYEIDL